MHPVAKAIVRHLPEALKATVDWEVFGRKERSGRFHASDLNTYHRTTPDYAFCLRQYLGLPCAKAWKSEVVLSIGVGLGIDAITRLAMDQAGAAGEIEVETQAALYDETLLLGGTPDLIWECFGDSVVGDVKSTDRFTFRSYWGNPGWDLSRASFWRQLQAYLMLLGTDEGLFLPVDRDRFYQAVSRGGDLDRVAEAITARPFYRDEVVIGKITADLELLRERVARYEATEDPAERDQLLRFA